MTVTMTDEGLIALSGDCPAEDADELINLLLANPTAEVDWRACERAHTAVVQVLLASLRGTHGPPPVRFLRNWIEPLLAKPVNLWPSN